VQLYINRKLSDKQDDIGPKIATLQKGTIRIESFQISNQFLIDSSPDQRGRASTKWSSSKQRLSRRDEGFDQAEF
jgi:hypothetical protein